jgi:putative tricarboxylic transport membrane protein
MAELSLVPGVMRVTNLPGAGGAIAYAHAVARRRGDANVLIAASPATTLRLAQGQFGRFTEDSVRWVGALAADYGIIAVSPGSPWTSLTALLAAWRSDPARVVAGGGSAVGGQDHMKLLVLARAAGIDSRAIRYVPFDGGGEALTTLLGGFIQVFSGDASEVRGHIEAGTLRVLAVLAPERQDGLLADVPTAIEQGIDATWVAWRGFYAPPGVSDSEIARWALAINAVAYSDEWARLREATGLAPFTLAGPLFEEYVRDEVAALRTLSQQLGLIE